MMTYIPTRAEFFLFLFFRLFKITSLILNDIVSGVKVDLHEKCNTSQTKEFTL